jgi:hypothetical protein
LIQQEIIITGLFTDGLLKLKYGVKLSQRVHTGTLVHMGIDRFTGYSWMIGSERTGTKRGREHSHRWALFLYFIISLPLVTIVSQRLLVSLSIWIVSNE